jgi:tRNA nucleotidyltransferase (CCA-adding enzyme)
MKIPPIITKIADDILALGGTSLLVGGSVRDHFLGIVHKDFDIEVYGISTMQGLQKIIEKYGTVNIVGKSFGVLKFCNKDLEIDFSLPRTESKIGNKHIDFSIKCDGNLPFDVAFRRRDFTVNAIGFNILTKEIIDPYGGLIDLKNRILRHIDDKSFIEDSLRVYRAAQFCARFGFILFGKTEKLCADMVSFGALDYLPKERIFWEFNKLLLKSPKPSIGFEILKRVNALRYFPELLALVGVLQNPEYHPEGDVWVHTMMSVDEMAKLKTGNDKRDLVLLFAILCHDFGKPATTTLLNGKLISHNHDNAGVEPTILFLKRLTDDKSLIESVIPLVKYHLAPFALYRDKSSKSAVRRLALKVNIENLVLVAKADTFGRTLKNITFFEGEWLLDMAKMLNVEKYPVKNFIGGKDLIELGLKPSKDFKRLLDYAYNLQLDEKVVNKSEAIDFIKKII